MIILKTLSCKRKINATKFENYCMDTAKLFISLYSWYHMPITVHKVLIRRSLLPISFYSEEAIEARHKDAKKIRLTHTRKKSELCTNEDLFKRLLLTSDPLISMKAKVH